MTARPFDTFAASVNRELGHDADEADLRYAFAEGLTVSETVEGLE